MLINLLKIRIGDINFDAERPYEFYHDEFIKKLTSIPRCEDGSLDIEETDVKELSRVQLGEILSNPNLQKEFVSLMAEDTTHNFYISVDKWEKEKKDDKSEISKRFNFGNGDEDDIYYAVTETKPDDFRNCTLVNSIVVNLYLEDPFVHFDYTTGALHLPRKILEMNKTFVEVFSLQDLSEDEVAAQNDLTDLLSYSFRAGYWLYKDTEGYLDSEEIAHFKNPENWLIKRPKLEVTKIEDGETQWIPVLSMPTDMLHVVRTNGLSLGKELPNWDDITYEPVFDFDFKDYFQSETSSPGISIFYTTGEMKQFMLVQAGVPKANARPISLALMDFPNEAERCTFDASTYTMFIPIKAVNLHTHALLTHMQLDWQPKDYLAIGIDKSDGSMNGNMANLISSEFLRNYADSHDLRTSCFLYLYTISGLFNPKMELEEESEKLALKLKDKIKNLKSTENTEENILFINSILFGEK